MKDSVLNTILISALFSAIAWAAFGDSGPEAQPAMAQTPRVFEMEKTVVAAKRLPEDVLIASARQ